MWSNLRFRILKAGVGRLKAQIRRLKPRVEANNGDFDSKHTVKIENSKLKLNFMSYKKFYFHS